MCIIRRGRESVWSQAEGEQVVFLVAKVVHDMHMDLNHFEKHGNGPHLGT